MNVCQLKLVLQKALDTLNQMDGTTPVSYIFVEEQGEPGRGRTMENFELRPFIPQAKGSKYVELYVWYERK